MQFKTEKSKCIQIITDDDKSPLLELNDNCQIKILSEMTEVLFRNKLIDNSKFTNCLKEFPNILIEIKYPHKLFKEIYEYVINLKKSEIEMQSLKLVIFISGFQETDQMFRQNKDIDFIRIDSSVTKIKSMKNGINSNGSFEGCTSLNDACNDPIGSFAFKNCSS